MLGVGSRQEAVSGFGFRVSCFGLRVGSSLWLLIFIRCMAFTDDRLLTIVIPGPDSPTSGGRGADGAAGFGFLVSGFLFRVSCFGFLVCQCLNRVDRFLILNPES